MKKTILSEEQVNFIQTNVKTQTLTELANNVGLQRQTLTRLLKELGLIKKTRITLDEKTFIITKYLEGRTLLEIAKEINVSKTQVSAILKIFGVATRPQTTLQRKLKYNEFIFDDINTKEKAYFLGLLYADGYNCESRNTVSLRLSAKDVEILYAFKEFISYSGEVKFCQKNINFIDITNNHLSKALAKLGCTQAKTNTIEFPLNLSSNFLASFLLGYSDGDGCFSMSGLSPEWSICSNELFCSQVKKFLESKNIKTYLKKRNGCYGINTKGYKQVLAIYNLLYCEPPGYYLNRKFNRAQEILKIS